MEQNYDKESRDCGLYICNKNHNDNNLFFISFCNYF